MGNQMKHRDLKTRHYYLGRLLLLPTRRVLSRLPTVLQVRVLLALLKVMPARFAGEENSTLLGQDFV